MALDEYRRKRDLTTTPEPAGGKPRGKQLRFVVQKHHASHLHYDFRLELDGVLKSWAIPKGPSLDPAAKRLAMQVEDHPYDYRTFEGIIPEGNYGAGTVMVWDEGTYTDPEVSSPAEARKKLKAGLMKGELRFVLKGEKLHGQFALTRVKNDERSDNAWLLIKKADDYSAKVDVTAQDRSVKTGRSLDEIAREGELLHVPLELESAPKGSFPSDVSPMLANLVAEPFDGQDWQYEVKWDGYRILAYVKAGEVKLMTRGGQDYADRYRPVVDDLKRLAVDCVLDGEVVVVDEDGRSDFGALQQYQRTGEGNLLYYVFDCLWADGRTLVQLPLSERQTVAQTIVQPLEVVRYSDHIDERGTDFFKLAEQQGLEGIMAKRRDSTYQAGKRGRDWLKIKTHQRQEAVIGGFTAPKGGRKKLGALVLGVYEDGALRYIGHTGGGLDSKEIDQLYARLKPLARKSSPFSTSFKTNAPVTWVSPKLMCEVNFAGWTSDGHLRQPIFVGLREDKPAKTVVQERELPAPGKVELTHLEKVFWPKQHHTKGDMIAYYDGIAELILPYLAGRPQSLNRFPNGIEGDNFFQKDVEHHPEWVTTVPIYSESNEKDLHWLVCDDRDSLLYLANLGCIELNPWLSRVSTLDRPDFCLIDIDAKTNQFADVITVARSVKEVVDELGIPGYPKTSGKTGLHVCIPLGAKYSFDQSKLLAELIVRRVHDRLPKLTSIERSPSKRKGKIYLDYLQNRTGQTMAAPYCLRPVPGACVSTPLDWREVNGKLDPTAFTIKTIVQRIEKVGDLWKPVIGYGIDLKRVIESAS